jgi:hypothetical protein
MIEIQRDRRDTNPSLQHPTAGEIIGQEMLEGLEQEGAKAPPLGRQLVEVAPV